MPCYNPLTAYKTAGGSVVFVENRKAHGDTYQITLACGQCHGCRLERSRQWATRCVHEAAMHKYNAFVTLTYNEDNVPNRSQLQHEDFQKFMKRLRKHTGLDRVRFYMGGEYGPEHGRPHFHAAIFGYDFPDKKYFKRSPSGERIYTSEILEKLWPYGYSSTAELTFESAAYIARYCMQKVTGPMAEEHYKRQDEKGEYQLKPEYNRMSLKPGIGATWLNKYKTDVYTYDHVIINGVQTRPPKYYDKLIKKEDPDKLAKHKEERERKGTENRTDNTPQRLEAKQIVAIAKSKQLLRGKI
ncbi:MAG: replication initiator protein [Microviridae sp.]|nr:MAG: replication initiator protein [Microviridae sp.]